MPDPQRLLTTLRKAVQAVHDTPCRRGHLVVLQEVSDVLVAGDLHGNVENFRQILGQAALDRHPRRHLVLQELIHGPFAYPDGSDKSHQLVDLLAALKCQYPQRVHYLLGNHELAQWTGRRIEKDEREVNDAFRKGVLTAYGSNGQAIYAAYLTLFAVLPLAVRTPNRVYLCHSLPSGKRVESFDPAVLERSELYATDLTLGGSVHSLVWGRDTSAATAATFLNKVDADLVITGHIVCPQGFAVPNSRQLILDTLGAPACYCLFPAEGELDQQELIQCVRTL
jgi:hypothetical protein